MISIYAGIIGTAAVAGSIAGSYFYGVSVGSDLESGKAARDREVVAIAMDASNAIVAEGLSRITVTNTTIRQQLETKTRETPYPVDCRLAPDVVRLLNSTPGIAPAASAAGGGELPSTDAPR